MAKHKNKNTNNKVIDHSNIFSTIGLTVMSTAISITVHHLWRKRNNTDAKLSDYLAGTIATTTEQFERIKNANNSWLQSYKTAAHTYVDRLDTKSNEEIVSAQINKYDDIDVNINVASYKKCQDDTSSTLPVVNQVEWVSGVANIGQGESDEFSVVGIDKEREIVWQTAVPERVHDIVVQPLLTQKNSRHVAVMGRRPSDYFWIMDCATGEIIHSIRADSNRHYYGHACYSLDGSTLYVTENDTKNFNGIIGVYTVGKDTFKEQGYRKVNEFMTQGIGPHELTLHPSGNILIVANGGIKTERASREELNLESMQPSLVYLSLISGEMGKVLQKIEPKHNQMSVRHISVVTEGVLKDTVAIGIQFQGEKHLDIPLVLTHKFGDEVFVEYQPNKKGTWKQFHHYIASLIVNSKDKLICVSSPIGGCASIFAMDGVFAMGSIHKNRMLKTIKIADCAGIAVADKGFLVSDGQGGLTFIKLINGTIVTDTIKQPMAFDNHMQRVT